MKSTILLLLLISVSAFAKTESYQCFTKEKLPTKITVEFSECVLTEQKTFDICEADEGKIVIPRNSDNSLLLTPAGESLELSCREYNDPATGPDTQMQQQQQPTQSPTPTRSESREGPGHGGSNIRGRQ